MIHSDFHLHTSHSSDSQASLVSPKSVLQNIRITVILKIKKILIFWWIYPHINLNYYH